MNEFLIPIQKIPGPTFLVIYVFLGIILLIVLSQLKRLDGTNNLPLPDPNALDPYELAALRASSGSTRPIIETVLFEMWFRKFIKTIETKEGEFGSAPLIERVEVDTSQLHPLERKIFDYLEKPRKITEILENSAIILSMEDTLRQIYAKLADMKLIFSQAQEDIRNKIKIFSTFLVVFFLSFGALKIYLGIINKRPIGFLVFLEIIAAIGLFSVVFSETSNLTDLGRRYLKYLQKHFEWLKQSVKQETENPDFDPAFSVALFGVGVLGGVALYSAFTNVLPSPIQAGGFYGGADGGSCSSSSCSSSGCGGGGCGGCGGCGA